ncbi:MAG: DUF6114 domain-containing protein [Halorientalis sp.]
MSESSTRGPILGPLVVVVAGVVIAVVPFRFQHLLSMIGGGNTVVGLFFGATMIACGVLGHLKYEFSTELGIVAMVLSILSLFGAFGGLLVGLILGLIGGNLMLAWKPPSYSE